MDLRAPFDRLKQAHLNGAFTYEQRIELLTRLDAAVRRHREDLVAACNADFGRRARIETLGADVMVTLDEIKYARKHLRRWMRPQRRSVNLTFRPARGEIRFLPLGVVGVVAPWNYPFQLALIPLVNAIAAGNRVMIKPSEFTPAVSALVEKLVAEKIKGGYVEQGGAVAPAAAPAPATAPAAKAPAVAKEAVKIVAVKAAPAGKPAKVAKAAAPAVETPPEPKKPAPAAAASPAADQSLCISGKLPSGRKKSDYEAPLRAVGIALLEDVVKGLTYLVVADPATTSAKAEKARKLGVEVISEDQLQALLG